MNKQISHKAPQLSYIASAVKVALQQQQPKKEEEPCKQEKISFWQKLKMAFTA